MRLDPRIAKVLWRVLASVFLLLGVIGIVLPVLPTVPFIIAAAWAGGRGWPQLETWLLGHPKYGVHIQRWRQGGMVPRRAKVLAISMMTISAIGLQFADLPWAVRLGTPLVMAVVALWLWTRPEP
ncbi:YbaN family protein [Variovorax sp. J22P168]|uniref:YbaN family protein n=1 Tax=Variovorax jilinensis TaxID=3053513 RepID=UPI002574B967|nr:YbaN family protein [Variovorax sp. J22P168]MDM0014670.1 YbaN family protein [Variovorax sp. J22P168]